MTAKQQLKFEGCLLENEPMAKYTSWRVGGAAQRFFKPKDKADLITFLQQLDQQEPVTFVGLGSNLLVRDGGIQGTVISLQGILTELRVELDLGDAAIIYAEAGVTCAQLARFSAKQSLKGGEFFAGIPGTVGGALAMNAGAFGGETWQFVEQVETLNRQAQAQIRLRSDYEIAYRSVKKPVEDEWFISGHFRFLHDAEQAGEERIKSLLSKRSATQPIGVYSCGSVFRNPAGDYAARLIEEAGLKGYSIGGARVSEKHANFIVNQDNARAEDIENLIQYVQQQVELKTGVLLKPEVQVIGERQ